VFTELFQALLSEDVGKGFQDFPTQFWISRPHAGHGVRIATMWKYLAVTADHSPKTGSEAPSTDWIRERLSPPQSGVVTSVVPMGFEAYVRILHPVQVPSGEDPLVRWADVSKWSGVALHPRVQWHEVALPQVNPLTEPPWRSRGPRQGSLYLSDAEVLIEEVVPYTSTLQECYFCVWSGYGGGVTVRALPSSGTLTLARRFQPPRIVELPWREYELFEGPLAGALNFEV